MLLCKLYDCESWTLTVAQEKSLDGTYTRMLRKVLDIHWSSHITNESLYGNLLKVSDKIASKRLQLAGNCFRHSELSAQSLVLREPNRLKDTTESVSSVSYLDVLLEKDLNGILTTKLYDKRDDFNFSIVNFPYLCSNIPSSPAYGVFVSQLIRYARACSTYDEFLKRGMLLTNKLNKQDYQQSRLKSSFRKFYGRYNDLVSKYNLPLSQMLNDVFHTIC